MKFTTREALLKAQQLQSDGVISSTAKALITLAEEFKLLVGEEAFNQILENTDEPSR